MHERLAHRTLVLWPPKVCQALLRVLGESYQGVLHVVGLLPLSFSDVFLQTRNNVDGAEPHGYIRGVVGPDEREGRKVGVDAGVTIAPGGETAVDANSEIID